MIYPFKGISDVLFVSIVLYVRFDFIFVTYFLLDWKPCSDSAVVSNERQGGLI